MSNGDFFNMLDKEGNVIDPDRFKADYVRAAKLIHDDLRQIATAGTRALVQTFGESEKEEDKPVWAEFVFKTTPVKLIRFASESQFRATLEEIEAHGREYPTSPLRVFPDDDETIMIAPGEIVTADIDWEITTDMRARELKARVGESIGYTVSTDPGQVIPVDTIPVNSDPDYGRDNEDDPVNF